MRPLTRRRLTGRVLGVLLAMCGFGWIGWGGAGVATALQSEQRPDRSKPPATGAPPAFRPPPVRTATLSNGLRVSIVEVHEVPLVQVNLVLAVGSGDEPGDQFGVASLTAAMLDEGAGTRSSLELADAFEFLGATLTTGSSFDASVVRLNVPVARLTDALPLLADVALRPTFPGPDLERLRQERLTALLQARDNAAAIASAAFARVVFGPKHRYGSGATGTQASLTTLTVNDLRAFHASHYVPSAAAMLVVGDVRADAILPQLERQFGSWAGARGSRRLPPAADQLAAGQIVLVDKPGAAQSQIRIGWVGVARSTPDYFTLEVLNTILGGSFTSRLNQNLREKNGYTYGASSAFDMRLAPGPFLAAAGVQTDRTADALREFFVELEAIRRPVGADELARAKNYLALGFPGEFETTADLARRLEDLLIYAPPAGFLERYMADVQAVTGAAVQKAAGRYIVPSRLAVVVVGDLKVVEPAIRGLKLGPIRHMTLDEAFGQ